MTLPVQHDMNLPDCNLEHDIKAFAPPVPVPGWMLEEWGIAEPSEWWMRHCSVCGKGKVYTAPRIVEANMVLARWKDQS